MATDVDVQYFSHLNGLVLGNNWGDLIRLLDKTLVTGIEFTEITAASIDEQGDVHITLYSAHNAMLFQVVELSGFIPSSLNQKYRIKGTPSATKLILKPSTTIAEKIVTTKGTGKLASLGYEIIFRDTGDVKRVYRAKNPRAEHPFIRVDETISDGVNSYNSSYAKSAMVGLIENMSHIDDYEDPSKLQLPLNTADFKKNWKITGTGTSVVRGWSRWYWLRGVDIYSGQPDSSPVSGNVSFTITGDKDAFYLCRPVVANNYRKMISGVGIYNSSLNNDVIPNWFLMTSYSGQSAGTSIDFSSNVSGGLPLCYGENASKFLTPTYSTNSRVSNHADTSPITYNFTTGAGQINGTSVAALEFPFIDSQNMLKGTLKHIYYSGNTRGSINTTALQSDKSMYVADSVMVTGGSIGGIYFYLGDLE